MRWTVHSERSLHTDQWLDLKIADVELPDGRHLDHRLIRMSASAGAVVIQQGKVLLLWRHRFITDRWGWEIPVGRIAPGETPTQAATREVEEETGWRPDQLRPLVYSQPSGGILDSAHHLFRADSATHVGPPSDDFESERISWVPLSDVKPLIDKREIHGGSALIGLLYVLTESG